MKVGIFNALTLLVFFINMSISRAEWRPDRPDSHAPIGVMGDHIHKKGESMLSYRYMFMEMDGLRQGSDRVSSSDVLENFMVAPTDMDMEMHMIGGMFAPRDWLTVMTMIPVIELNMNHVTRSGKTFQTRSSGLGDIRFSGLSRVFNHNGHQLILNSGISLPSGDIDERGDTPVAQNAKLPFPMQLGSGTVDLMPGLTYLGQYKDFSWGLQGIGTIRTGRNDNGYAFGDRFESTAWGAYLLNDWVSASLRVSWLIWGDISGMDSDLNPKMVPTADPSTFGGRRTDIALGMNFYVPKGSLKGVRIGGEFVLPVYQHLDGPTLENDWGIVLGSQYAF